VLSSDAAGLPVGLLRRCADRAVVSALTTVESGRTGAMMSKLCRTVFFIYVGLAAAALLLIPISALRLFGAEPSPLAGIFAVLLAQPWLSLASEAGGESIIGNLGIVTACLALNAMILWLVCRFGL